MNMNFIYCCGEIILNFKTIYHLSNYHFRTICQAWSRRLDTYFYNAWNTNISTNNCSGDTIYLQILKGGRGEKRKKKTQKSALQCFNGSKSFWCNDFCHVSIRLQNVLKRMITYWKN